MSGTNITIDDHDTLVTFGGDGWQTGPGCTGCSATPPALENVHDGTWRDGRLLSANPTDTLTAQLTFTGTAIYVFGITVNNTAPLPVVKNQDLLFSIDGKSVKEYTFTPNGPTYTYNVPFLSQTGLDPTQHTLLMSVKNNSFVLLDYFIYTQPPGVTSSSTSSNSVTAAVSSGTASHPTQAAATSPSPSATANSGSGTPVGTIIGAVVGSLGGITIIAFVIFLVRYYRQGLFDEIPLTRMSGQPNRGPGAPGPNPTGSVPGGSSTGGAGEPSTGALTSGAAAAHSSGQPSTILSALTARSKNKNRVGPNAVEPFIVPPPRPPPQSSSQTHNGSGKFFGGKSSSSIQRPSTSIDPPTSSSGVGAAAAAEAVASSSGRKKRKKRSRSLSKPKIENPSSSTHSRSDHAHAPSSNNPPSSTDTPTNTSSSNNGLPARRVPRSEAGSAITHPELSDSGIRASHWKPPPPLPDVKPPAITPGSGTPPVPTNRNPSSGQNDLNNARKPSNPNLSPMPVPSPPAGAQTPSRDMDGNPYEVAFSQVRAGETRSGSRPLPQPMPQPPPY